MNRRNCLAVFLAASMIAIVGCGPSLTTVKGVVKLDGTAVSGATVVFVSEDGKNTYSGQSDASGSFTITGADGKSGVPAGNYKVTVSKRSGMGGGEMAPDSAEAMAAMKKASGDPSKMKPGGLMPGKMPGGPGGPAKSELPAKYASTDSTPLSVKVPLEKDLVLELSAK
jgi:hypothetical protein